MLRLSAAAAAAAAAGEGKARVRVTIYPCLAVDGEAVGVAHQRDGRHHVEHSRVPRLRDVLQVPPHGPTRTLHGIFFIMFQLYSFSFIVSALLFQLNFSSIMKPYLSCEVG